tara:strand:- start:454 stop:1704 length:1251 start_codon:yes stop_codon:yes gene_type:complete
MSKTKKPSPPNAARIDAQCAYDELKGLEALTPHPRNPNTHSEAQVALLAKVIKHQGWRAPIVVSKRSGFIVAGHARLKAAQQLGLDVAPVDFQEFETEADEWAHLVADNRIAELAEVDNAALKDLLLEMDTGAIDMDLTGFDHAALEELMTQFHVDEEPVDAEPQIDKADELAEKWGTKLGQIWELGEHRVACGDSTVKEVVSGLMRDEVAGLMVTDPPYGVEYDANWRNDALVKLSRAIGKVENDSRADWSEAWKLFAGDVAYVWHAGNKAHISARSLAESGFELVAQIVWAKNNIVIGRGNYHPKHEPCWYAVRKGGKRHFTDDRTQCTLWEIDKPRKSETGHSTQKPLECMARPIRNHAIGLIYDPFLGSGTTLMACENLGRKCRGIELSPEYVAVTIERWHEATGKEPKLIK